MDDIYEKTLEEVYEEYENEFCIDSPELADWAITKVIEEQKRFEIYEQAAKDKIERLKEQVKAEKERSEGRSSWLRYKLGEYLDTTPAKTTKTQKSLKLPSGSIVCKFEKLNYVPADGAKSVKESKSVLNWCKENANDFVKSETKESVDWAELKKKVKVIGGVVYYTETGEEVEGLTYEMSPKEIEVKE